MKYKSKLPIIFLVSLVIILVLNGTLTGWISSLKPRGVSQDGFQNILLKHCTPLYTKYDTSTGSKLPEGSKVIYGFRIPLEELPIMIKPNIQKTFINYADKEFSCVGNWLYGRPKTRATINGAGLFYSWREIAESQSLLSRIFGGVFDTLALYSSEEDINNLIYSKPDIYQENEGIRYYVIYVPEGIKGGGFNKVFLVKPIETSRGEKLYLLIATRVFTDKITSLHLNSPLALFDPNTRQINYLKSVLNGIESK